MYSVVLMAAMATTPETPDFLFRRRGHDCCGCQGGGSGCCGNPCGSCGRSSCGCCGMQQSCGCCGVQQACGGCGMQMGCGCMGMQQACGGCGMQMGCGCMGGMMVVPQSPTPPSGEKKSMLNSPNATIVVTGAKDATISIDGYVTTSTGDTRVLVSPALEAGQVYHYNVKAETVRDGQTVTLNRVVTVRAGETSTVNLDFAGNAVVLK